MTPEERFTFDLEGYLVVKSVLDRDEVDAMRVMGINPVQRLVVPRIAAMLIVAPLLNILIITVGIVVLTIIIIVGLLAAGLNNLLAA